MIKVKAITLREREELEPLLIESPDIIEEGLRVLDHQHPTDSGPLDILAADSEGTLVVIELKNEASEGQLDQGLRYYDWCRQNIAWISQAYSAKAKIVPESIPRLILIAPNFTDTVRRLSKYIDAELDLLEYHAFQNEKGEKGIICTKIDYGQPPTAPDIPSIEKKIEYFQSEEVKALFRIVLDSLSQKQIEIKPINGRWISFWYKGKRFMYMSPARNFFVAEILGIDGNWHPRTRISNKNEWGEVYSKYIESYLRYLDENRS